MAGKKAASRRAVKGAKAPRTTVVTTSRLGLVERQIDGLFSLVHKLQMAQESGLSQASATPPRNFEDRAMTVEVAGKPPVKDRLRNVLEMLYSLQGKQMQFDGYLYPSPQPTGGAGEPVMPGDLNDLLDRIEHVLATNHEMFDQLRSKF